MKDTSRSRRSRLSRTALTLDAATSGTPALIQVLAPHAVADLTGVGVAMLVVAGALQAAYAALLLWIASGTSVERPLRDFVIVGNVCRAVGLIAIATAAFDALTAFGLGYLVFQVAAVIALTGAQGFAPLPLPQQDAPRPRANRDVGNARQRAGIDHENAV